MKIFQYQLEELLEQGLSINDIAIELNCSSKAVRYAMNKYGIYYEKGKSTNRGKWANIDNSKYHLNDEGIKNLCVAIITQNVLAYRESVRHHKDPQQYRNFFRSEWYELLSSCLDNKVDGQRIIDEIEKGI